MVTKGKLESMYQGSERPHVQNCEDFEAATRQVVTLAVFGAKLCIALHVKRCIGKARKCQACILGSI